MRKYLFLLLLVVAGPLLGQDDTTYFGDLPVAPERNDADQLTVVQGNSVVRMTTSTLLEDVQLEVDLNTVHRTLTGGLNPHSVTAWDVLPDTTGQGGKDLRYGTDGDLQWTTPSGSGGVADSSALSYQTDAIREYTPGQGVVVQGVKFSDNDILLGESQLLKFSDHVYQYAPSNSVWYTYVNSVFTMKLTPGLLTTGSGGIQVGNGEASLIYTDLNNNLTLMDAVTGAVALADIAALAVGDTIPIEEVCPLLADSTLLWCWDFTDSAQFVNDRWMTRFYHAGPDTLAIEGVRAGAVGGSPDFEWNICYNDSLSFTGNYTKCWTTDLVVSGTDATTVGEVDVSPDNPSIPPGNYVFLYLDGMTSKPTYGCSFNVFGYEY